MNKLYRIKIWLSTAIDSVKVSFARNNRGERIYRNISPSSRERLEWVAENRYHEIYIGKGYLSIDMWIEG